MNALGLSAFRASQIAREAAPALFDLRRLRGYESAGGYVPLDIDFYRATDGSWSSSLDRKWVLAGQDFSGWTTLYLSPDGNDANVGTSAALPKQNIGTAIGVSSPRRIILPNGAIFYHAIGWRGVSARNPLIVETADPYGAPAIISARFGPGPFPWAWDASTGLWKLTQSAVTLNLGNVWDYSVPTEDGLGLRYEPATDLANCQATPYSCWKDASHNVYVNHPLGAAWTPDPAQLVPYVRSSIGSNQNAQSTWLRVLNVVFDGGSTPFSSDNGTSTEVDEAFWNCTFQRAGTLNTAGTIGSYNCTYMNGPGRSVLVGCVAKGGSSDGFNYQDNRRFVEWGCEGVYNGWRDFDPSAGGANQGSTSHGAKGIRGNGRYENNGTAGCQDVKSGSNQSAIAIFGCILGGGRQPDPTNIKGGLDLNGCGYIAGNDYADQTQTWILDPTWRLTRGSTAQIGLYGNGSGSPTVYVEDDRYLTTVKANSVGTLAAAFEARPPTRLTLGTPRTPGGSWSVAETNKPNFFRVPVPCVLSAFTLMSDTNNGTCTVAVKKVTAAEYAAGGAAATGTTLSTVSMVSGDAGTKRTSGLTTAFAAGDFIVATPSAMASLTTLGIQVELT